MRNLPPRRDKPAHSGASKNKFKTGRLLQQVEIRGLLNPGSEEFGIYRDT